MALIARAAGYTLYQRSDHAPNGASQLVFINKVLLEHSHTHTMHSLCMLLHENVQIMWLQPGPYGS